MFDLIVVIVLSLSLVGLLIGLVVLAVKHETISMVASVDRADAMLAKISQFDKVSSLQPQLVRVEAKPYIKPIL